jgi:hypothetical protein
MHLRSDRFLRHFADEIVELKLIPNKSGTKVTDAGLKAMTRLTSLNLICNKTITDSGLSNLSLLRTLILDANVISNASLVRLTGLTALTLMRCSHITMDGIRVLTNLTHLSLNEDRLKYPNDCLKKLTKLESLSLAYNKVISDSAFSRLNNLTHLDLRKTEYVTDATMKHLTNLTSLIVSGSSDRITDEGLLCLDPTKMKFLSIQLTSVKPKISNASVNRLTNLTTLHIGCSGALTLDCMHSMHNITSLNLFAIDHQSFSDDGISHLTALTHLDLSYNKGITDESIKLFAPLLATLYLGPNKRITDDALSLCVNLTELDLFRNPNITNASLLHCTALLILRLERNSLITIDGISDTCLSRLTTLDLNSNKMFCNADLLRFSNLSTLNLMYNNYITDGAIASLTSLTDLEARSSGVHTNTVTWADADAQYTS